MQNKQVNLILELAAAKENSDRIRILDRISSTLDDGAQVASIQIFIGQLKEVKEQNMILPAFKAEFRGAGLCRQCKKPCGKGPTFFQVINSEWFLFHPDCLPDKFARAKKLASYVLWKEQS